MSDPRYFRKGLGNHDQIAPLLHADYHNSLIEYVKTHDHRIRFGATEVRLAHEFGFCYGVDRAVEYAYASRDRFPDRRIWITGEIIHNPWVNRRLEEMGIRFLDPPGTVADRLAVIDSEDVVLIPAFGVENDDFLKLRDRGAILVDTTCGSVLNVWKSVERYAKDGYTAVVHGKVQHEETRATCSQVTKHPDGRWLVLRDREEATWVCDYLEGRLSADELRARLGDSWSEGFDPDRDLLRIGVANQTTMLSSESLEIAEMIGRSMALRFGEEKRPEHFRSFDTICSATQERQDAVGDLIRDRVDLMVVIGGFNSSNTTHLVEMSAKVVPAYHVEDANCLISPDWIRHQPLGEKSPVLTQGWLPAAGAGGAGGAPLVIGVTSGASTPNSETGRTIWRLLAFRGMPETELSELVHGARESASPRA